MSEPSKPHEPGRTLPNDIAASAGMPNGSAERSLHAVTGSADRPPPGNLDPHAKPQDFSARPDPAGTRDPLGAASPDTHLRPQTHGSSVGDASRRVQDAASQAKDEAAGYAARARDQAANAAGAVQDRLRDTAQDMRERASGVYDDAREWVSDMHRSQRRRAEDVASRGREQLHQGRTAVEQFVAENPLLVGVVGVAAGLLLGALLPRTRHEDANLGPYADELRDQGMRYAREFTHRGREFVENALDPDNLNAAQRPGTRGPGEGPAGGYQGSDRTAHRL
ncbi:hypothetical protein [Methylobacterium nigriterrae]|uniref:hypothetical protein n=1 Tax=Methylobacterium nigriterrae TaxID=3127512 RepID=UPI003013C454